MMRNSTFVYLAAQTLVEGKRRLLYPAALIWSLVSTGILFVIQVALWKYAKLGSDPSYTVSYFLVVAMLRPFMAVGVGRRLQERYNSGDIVYDLSRPTALLWIQAAQDVSSSIVSFFTVSVPAVILLGFLYNARWVSLSLVPSFIVSVIQAYGISWLLAYIVGCSVFHLKNNEGVLLLHHHLVPLLSGALVPIDALPKSIRSLLYALPFRTMYDLPIRIFTASGASEAAMPLLFQLGWLIFLALTAYLFAKVSMRKAEIYGG
jgi:ABC-type uncharacterized transport system permease subunit